MTRFVFRVLVAALLASLTSSVSSLPMADGIVTPASAKADAVLVGRLEPLCEAFGGSQGRAVNVLLNSPWLDRRKALALASAKDRRWTAAVAPVEIAGHGIDETERLLIAHSLAAALAIRGKATVSDPYVMAAAGGEGMRVPDPDAVKAVAAISGADTIYWPLVCHDSTGTLRLLVRVEELDGGRSKSVRQFGPFDVRISGGSLPSDALRKLLDAGIDVPGLAKPSPASNPADSRPAVSREIPKTLWPAPGVTEADLDTAYRLQLLAMLVPTAAESMRIAPHVATVALLDRVAPGRESSLLRARAFFHLGRRMAALAALETVEGADADALRALLDANAVDARKHADRIEDPLQRLFAEIDVYDIHYRYELLSRTQRMDRVMSVVGAPDWLPLLKRRLSLEESWAFVSSQDLAREVGGLRAALLEEASEPGGIRKGLFGYTGNEQEPQRLLLKRYAGHVLDAMFLANTLHGVRFRYFAQGDSEQGLVLLQRARQQYEGNADFIDLDFRIAEDRMSEGGDSDRIQLSDGAMSLSLRGALYMQSARGEDLGLSGPYSSAQAERLNEIGAGYAGDLPVQRCSLGLIADKAAEQRAREYIANTPHAFWCAGAYAQYLQRFHGDAAEVAYYRSMLTRFKDDPERFQGEVNHYRKRGDYDALKKVYERWLGAGTDSAEPYEEMSYLTLVEGNAKDAVSVMLSYPGYQAGSDANRLSLTYHASKTGWRLYKIGEFDLARKMDSVAISYNTASGYEYGARSRLLLLSGDLRAYAENKWAAYRHYGRVNTLKDYMHALLLLGQEEAAWKLFSEEVKSNDGLVLLWAAMAGLKLEGKSDDEVRRWFQRPELKSYGTSDPELVALAAAEYFTVDRIPGADLAGYVQALEGHNEKLYTDKVIVEFGAPAEDPFAYIQQTDQQFLAEKSQALPSELLRYVEISARVASKEYSRACDVHRRVRPLKMLDSDKYLGPHIAYACVMAGDIAAVRKMLQVSLERGESAEPAYDHNRLVATAFIKAAEGDHNGALAAMKTATRTESSPEAPVYLRFQILQAYERLLQITGNPVFRAEGLAFARHTRRGEPHQSVGHAYTALWSTDRAEQVDALVWTLYLDKHSVAASRVDQALHKQAIARLPKLRQSLAEGKLKLRGE